MRIAKSRAHSAATSFALLALLALPLVAQRPALRISGSASTVGDVSSLTPLIELADVRTAAQRLTGSSGARR